MNFDETNIGSTLMMFSGILGIALGGYDALGRTLIYLVALDYITGVFVAISNKKLSSAVGFKGICKKALIFVLIIMGNIFDKYIIGSGSTLRTSLIIFYVSNECISIIENAGVLGLPVPKKLSSVIQELSKKNK